MGESLCTWVRAYIKDPTTNFGGCVRSGEGKPSRSIFHPDPNLLPAPPDFGKNIALAFLKAALTKNLILSALHLQGPKSNIYVHVRWINKQLIGISLSNVAFVVKRPSKMQGQCFFSKVGRACNNFRSGSKMSREGFPYPDLTSPKVCHELVSRIFFGILDQNYNVFKFNQFIKYCDCSIF